MSPRAHTFAIALMLTVVGPTLAGVAGGGLTVVALAIAQQTKPAGALRRLQAMDSRVVMDLPDAFQPAERFSGFLDASRNTSIVVATFPAAAYKDVIGGFAPEALAQRGFLNIRVGTLKRERPYTYIRADQPSTGGPVAKFMAVLPLPDTTVLITVNAPKSLVDSGRVKVADIETALATARVADVEAASEPQAYLADLGPFRVFARLGTTTLYTPTGTDGPGTPMLIFTPTSDLRPSNDLLSLSEAALKSLAHHTDIVIDSRTDVTVVGRPALEITATARDEQKQPRHLLQIVVADPASGYVRIIGSAPAADAAVWFSRVRAAAQSLQMKP